MCNRQNYANIDESLYRDPCRKVGDISGETEL